VYLHKTVLSAENMLVKILQRAKELATKGYPLFSTPALNYFLYNNISKKDFLKNPAHLDQFSKLDDYDIFSAIKVWAEDKDEILSYLCTCLIERKLYKVEIQNEPFAKKQLTAKIKFIQNKMPHLKEKMDYFVFSKSVSNEIYNVNKIGISILFRDGKVKDISKSSDQLNVEVLNKTVKKWFICNIQ
jgi:HD superfamily phosphohydrolase